MLNKIKGGGFWRWLIPSLAIPDRAAEDAAKALYASFINAIKQITIQDALGILKGGDFAHCKLFKSKTTRNWPRL